MNRSSSPTILRAVALPVAILALGVAIFALVAGGAIGRGGDGARPSPSIAPSAPAPTLQPTTPPSAAPTDDPGDDVVVVDLDIATEHDVSVVIDDKTGSLVRAASGRAGDGMSVRWYTLKVENHDADTLRLTWVGFPGDDMLEMRLYRLDGKVAITLVQAGPPPNSDALGFDRVAILDFNAPVSADDVVTSMQAGTDTGD